MQENTPKFFLSVDLITVRYALQYVTCVLKDYIHPMVGLTQSDEEDEIAENKWAKLSEPVYHVLSDILIRNVEHDWFDPDFKPNMNNSEEKSFFLLREAEQCMNKFIPYVYDWENTESYLFLLEQTLAALFEKN